MSMHRFVLLAGALCLNAGLAQSPSTAVQGAGQLSGGDARVGQTYTLYPGTPEALNVTLRGAEYSVGHFLIREGDLVPAAGQKLLLLHLSVQNPQKVARFTRGDSVTLTGVDSRGAEVKPEWNWFDEQTHAPVELTLKPAQKLEVIAVMKVDGRSSVPKLILNTSGNRVWRYDLRGTVKGLVAPYADPQSKDGSVALDVVQGRTGTYYPAELDVRLDRVETVSRPLLGQDVPEGGRLLVLYVTLRNPRPDPQTVTAWMVSPRVFDQDDQALPQASDAFLLGREQAIGGTLGAGKELAVRSVVRVPGGASPRRLELKVNDSRTFTFELPATIPAASAAGTVQGAAGCPGIHPCANAFIRPPLR